MATLTQGSAPIPELEQALDLVQHPAHWSEGSQLARRANDRALELTETPGAEHTISLLYLAEKLAKLIYNASSPSDPFDEDIAEKFAEQVGQDAETVMRARLLAMDLLFPLSNSINSSSEGP